MRKLLAFLSCLVWFGIIACQPSGESRTEVKAAYDSLFNTIPDFSGVALIAEGGKPVYHKAFGYRDFNTKTPIDTSTIFELASVSKQFTSMYIMMLKEAGKLTYDDPVEKYIADLPYSGITIRHLLTHTGGLPEYEKIMDEHWDKTKQANNNDIIAYLKQYHPDKKFNPGTSYSYSNTGYVLLGTIAQVASGSDFIDFCRANFFKPIGMSSTDIRTVSEKSKIENFALGHIFVEEKSRFIRADSFPASNYIYWLGNRVGPGRISSTASDLLKWDQTLYSEKLIKKETLAEAFQPYRLSNDSLSYYGFGWMLQEKDPKFGTIVRHTGSNPGYNNIIIRYIDVNKTIIVLCNNAHPRYRDLVKGIEEILRKQAQ